MQFSKLEQITLRYFWPFWLPRRLRQFESLVLCFILNMFQPFYALQDIFSELFLPVLWFWSILSLCPSMYLKVTFQLCITLVFFWFHFHMKKCPHWSTLCFVGWCVAQWHSGGANDDLVRFVRCYYVWQRPPWKCIECKEELHGKSNFPQAFNLFWPPWFCIRLFSSTDTCETTKKGLHRPGIEPGPPAWQASILPLHRTNDAFLSKGERICKFQQKVSIFNIFWSQIL